MSTPPPSRVSPAEPVLTIGYGSRSVAELVALLQQHRFEVLVDVRSSPYSRFRPEFSREPLQAAVTAAGLRYVFQGQSLGGRPPAAECYEDGRVVYNRLREQPFYQEGILRLEKAHAQGMRLALMCSEGRPEECHRAKLIAETLRERGIPVLHVDEAGTLEPHSAVIRRLTGGQLGLFGGPDFASRGRFSPPGTSTIDDEA